MAEYEPLKRYLINLPYYQTEAVFTFAELEKILGRDLPPSARHHRPWWGNDFSDGSHPHAQAWLKAGWMVDAGGVNLEEEWVRFVRIK